MPDLKDLCRMNHLMVSGTKPSLIIKLIRCNLHGSAGYCPECGHSTLEFEYIDTAECDSINPSQLPSFVECRHFSGPGRKCQYGRRPVNTSSYHFFPMITQWEKGQSALTCSPAKRRKRRKRTLEVIDGFQGAVYLDVKYVDREIARSAGARWDSTNRLWYVPMELADVAADRFSRWMPKTEVVYMYKAKGGSGSSGGGGSSSEEEQEYKTSYE